jgi:flagellar motor switch protein FliN/FliY
VARILKIRVPVRVQLASRRMNIAKVRMLSVGTIIEFHKSIEEPLELLINNHPVGKGDAVKVDEHFGLRVSEVRDAATRIRSMGE